MADRASAMIISKRHILLIHRIRAEREFYVFPGGHIEEGESAEEACIREVQEETGLQTEWLEAAFEYAIPGQLARYFFVRVMPGRPVFEGPELQKRSETNRYLLEWVPLAAVGEINLQPEAVRDALVKVVTEDGPVREATDLALRRERLVEVLGGNTSGSLL